MKILSFVTINDQQANDITKLLNNNQWNRPSKPYTAEELLAEPEGYFLAMDENLVIGIARLKKVSWYQWELFSMNVHPDYRRRGIGKDLIQAAEEYVQMHQGGLMQATIDPHNKASIQLFTKALWKHKNTFIHPAYKKPYQVWNKVLD